MFTRNSTTTALLAVIVGCSAAAGLSQVSFRNFRNTTGLNLIGDATVQGRKIRLLPARANTRANVWTQKPYAVTAGFRASFSFQYTNQGGIKDANGNPGNDGILFYIQPGSNALQQDMDVPAKSLMVFFDGFRNSNVGDVSGSRIEVQLNGKRLGQTDVEPLGIRYREGKVVHARVEFDGSDLTVFLNDKSVAVYPHIDLTALSPGYVGFHAMGGDAYADVDLLDFSFQQLTHSPTEVAARQQPQRDPIFAP